MDLESLKNPVILLVFLIDALFLVQAITYIRNIYSNRNSSIVVPCIISIVFIITLLFLYVNNTVEIANVWLNSNIHTPLLYKIAGVWGNHEGSMLLFYVILTIWSAIHFNHINEVRLSSFFLLLIGGYIYLAANPFDLLAVKATAGQDLNPALQSPYLTIHPPVLYTGQTLCFVLWVWACITPNHAKSHLYTRICFWLITLGLALGSRWAYGELGWGGFWFWDPVETVSLFPWLAIAAAVHTGKDQSNLNRICLLTAFPLVLIGLTLVRSGVLVSVHSFGFDIYNGIWLGACALVASIISIISLCNNCSFVKQIKNFRSYVSFGFLFILGILTFLIIFPIFFKVLCNLDIAIDEKFFHQYVNPGLLFGLAFAGFAPYLKTNKWSFLCSSLCAIAWSLHAQPYFNIFASLASIVSFWLIFSSLNFCKKILVRGFVAAHIGVGLCILGASYAEIFTQKEEFDLSKIPYNFANHIIVYNSQRLIETAHATQNIISLNVDGESLDPQIQQFHISKITKHKPEWVRVGLDHIHATVFIDHGKFKIELMSKPYISIFWMGIIFVLIGISVSINNARSRSKNYLLDEAGKNVP